MDGIVIYGNRLSSPIQASDCWLDVYDKAELAGAHTRIEGPLQLPSLAKLNNENWGNRIESLVTGPKAKVIAFRQENYKENSQGLLNHGEAIKVWGERPESYSDQELGIGPGKEEHHLADVNFHRAINSLSIKCLP